MIIIYNNKIRLVEF